MLPFGGQEEQTAAGLFDQTLGLGVVICARYDWLNGLNFNSFVSLTLLRRIESPSRTSKAVPNHGLASTQIGHQNVPLQSYFLSMIAEQLGQ